MEVALTNDACKLVAQAKSLIAQSLMEGCDVNFHEVIELLNTAIEKLTNTS
jgi:hypothetical protein